MALDYFRSGGGPARLSSVHGGAQDVHLVGGTAQLSEGLAAELSDDLVLRSPVRKVTQTPDSGALVLSDRLTVRAGAVVVATAPGIAERISFSPDLPSGRRRLQQQSPLGSSSNRPWSTTDRGGATGECQAWRSAMSARSR